MSQAVFTALYQQPQTKLSIIYCCQLLQPGYDSLLTAASMK